MAMTPAAESVKVTAGFVRRFKIGDIVVLKSGGPPMTVWEVDAPPLDKVAIYRTNWFVGGELHRDAFSKLELDEYVKKLPNDTLDGLAKLIVAAGSSCTEKDQ